MEDTPLHRAILADRPEDDPDWNAGPNPATTEYPEISGGGVPFIRKPDDFPAFVVKDSGVREEYANGFVRDTEDGKPDYTRLLAIDGLELVPVEMIERWAAHMKKGAVKYGVDNWRQARGQVPRDRFLRSLVRHVVQYVRGDQDEDHASAIMFNVAARELVPDE